VIHLINATVMEGLPRDTHGNYRGPGEDVHVAIFAAPSALLVQSLLDELVAWLMHIDQTPPLVRSALLHLNVIAIHPFNDGNSRTARILAAMELVRDGVRSPSIGWRHGTGCSMPCPRTSGSLLRRWLTPTSHWNGRRHCSPRVLADCAPGCVPR
jgi:hypothetical protein